jgi:hypothetical protein
METREVYAFLDSGNMLVPAIFRTAKTLAQGWGLLVLILSFAQNGLVVADEPETVAMLQEVADFELAFLRTACQLEPAETAKLQPKLKAQVQVIAEQLKQNNAISGKANLNPGFRFQKGVVAETHALAYLDTSLYEFLVKQLTAEQQTIYEREWESRKAFWAESIVENLLVRLKEKLRLSHQQQDALRGGLIEWARHYVHLTSYLLTATETQLPALPDDLMFQHLDREQRSIWASLKKTDLHQVPIHEEVRLRFFRGAP